MPWSEFAALLALGTAMSFSPGPNTTLSTALAANHGLRHALPFVCGVPLGWGVLLGLTATGMGALVVAQPVLAAAIKWGGLAYLLWLAAKLWRSTQLGQADAQALRVGLWQGAVLQFVNIKAWMFALAVVAGWVAGKPQFAARMAVVMPTMMAFALLSNLAYAAMGATLRGWLAQGSRLAIFNRCMAMVLAATVLWLAVAQ